jgi:hypothetical protein
LVKDSFIGNLKINNDFQIDFNGVPVKRREIAHLKEDGGCGCGWSTVEVVEDVLENAGTKKIDFKLLLFN